MRPQRAIANSSLAFIDVMSCGLGAVILLFIILDFNQSPPEPIIADQIILIDETDTNALLSLQQQTLTKALLEKTQMLEKLISTVTQKMLIKNQQVIAIAKLEAPKEKLLKAKPIQTKSSSGQLIGLAIKGPRILIAFDTSASMADNKLINIILGISEKSGKRLAAGKKWKQAKETLVWTIENTPDNSQVQVISYSDAVRSLTAGWVSRDTALRDIERTLRDLGPEGGTSLGRMLEYVENIDVLPTDIYVITDGLPTISGDKGSPLANLKNCFRVPSRKNSYISGACREDLMVSAVQRFQKKSTARINVILLALEGDPKAAPLYWKWTSFTKGILFTPKDDWPSA